MSEFILTGIMFGVLILSIVFIRYSNWFIRYSNWFTMWRGIKRLKTQYPNHIDWIDALDAAGRIKPFVFLSTIFVRFEGNLMAPFEEKFSTKMKECEWQDLSVTEWDLVTKKHPRLASYRMLYI